MLLREHVVGTRIATCLPPMTALNAARIATSVLPKPTSPQIKAVHRAFGAFHVGFGHRQSRCTWSVHGFFDR